uniref:Uncharacterized protein n=1 Tax=Cannabis sativa TaxID=3483 RepID=A0A803NKJ8_CANSA
MKSGTYDRTRDFSSQIVEVCSNPLQFQATTLMASMEEIHQLPHEYSSISNGNDLGALAGSVMRFDLYEEKAPSLAKWLRVLIDLDVEKPLFSGCFINLSNGENVLSSVLTLAKPVAIPIDDFTKV